MHTKHFETMSILLGVLAWTVSSPTTVLADITWADTNQFSGKVVNGFNNESSILDGVCLDWTNLPDPSLAFSVVTTYGDAEDPESPDLLEYGALFYVAESDEAQAFDVRVMAADGSFEGIPPVAGNLIVRMRSFDPQGLGCDGAPACTGDDAAAEIPLVAGSTANASASNGLLPCWRSARIELSEAIPAGDYWFTLSWSTGAPDAFGITRETDANAYGVEIWSDGFWTTDPFNDPIIVVSQDPVVVGGNEAPTAVIVATNAILEDTPVDVDGSGSWSGNQQNETGDSITDYTWTFVSKPEGSQAAFADDAAAVTSFTPDLEGDYLIKLEVTDSHGLTDTAQHTVHANPHEAPVVAVPVINPVAVHAEDIDTLIMLSVNASDPGDDTPHCGNEAGFCYEWRARRVDNGATTTFSTAASPVVTVEDIGLGDQGRWHDATYEISVSVTNEDTDKSTTSQASELTISQWPAITFTAGMADWDVAGTFTFEMPVSVTLTPQHVGLDLTPAVLVLERPDRGPVLDTADIAGTLDPFEPLLFTDVLTLADTLVWDPGICFTPVPLGPLSIMEALTVSADGLVDTNGFDFGAEATVPSLEQLLTPVAVPPYKLILYEGAYLSLVLGGAHSIEAVALANPVTWPLSVVLFAAQAFDLWEWGHICEVAHDDPPGFDYEYMNVVPLSVTQVDTTAAVSIDESVGLAMAATEQGALIHAARNAYGQTYNKLFGAYADGNTDGMLLQSAELLRYGAVLDRELATYGANRLAAEEALGVPDVQEVIAFQQQVAAEGFPQREIAVLQQLGATFEEIDALESLFASLDPTLLADGAADIEIIDAMLRPFGPGYYSEHSKASAPGGWVIVATTNPLANRPVRGVIELDARVVHKKENSSWCFCGPTLITDVVIDGQQPPFNSIPYPPPQSQPPPNWCVPPPPPYAHAVPVMLDTTTLPDGSHTIAVTAHDSGLCPPVQDPREHSNTDTITFLVDNTPPTLTITSPDADPDTPGIQIIALDPITYTADDPVVNGYSSGLVDPLQGVLETEGGFGYDMTVRVADRAGNVADAVVQVIPLSEGNVLTIKNAAPGDGRLEATLDEYGSMQAVGGTTYQDLYDPAGAAGSMTTTYSSAWFLFIGDTHRELLSAGSAWQDYDWSDDDPFSTDDGLMRVVTAPNSLSDTTPDDGIADMLTSGFRVADSTGGDATVDLIFNVTQFVSAPDENGVAYLRQDYTITSNTIDPITFRLVRAHDADLAWQGNYANDWVGATSTSGWRHVYQREPADESLSVTVSSLLAPTGYYGSKHGVLPGDVPPAFGFGTSPILWQHDGLPDNWRDFVAGVGYDMDGVSGDVGTHPKDASMGLEFELTLGPAESAAITLIFTYGDVEPALLGCNSCDTNGDGLLDGEDVGAFLTALLAPTEATPLALCAADINGDGAVDAADVGPFVTALLAGACP